MINMLLYTVGNQSFLIKDKNSSQALKSLYTFIFQKGISDTCKTAPVMQSVASEFSPTTIIYSLLNFKSTQHFQKFSYVTRAHPDISWVITQYLNLGNILRRSPLGPVRDFCLFLGAKRSV